VRETNVTRAIIKQPGQGRTIAVVGDVYRFLATGDDTTVGATNLRLSTGSHLGDKPQFTGTLYFHMNDVRDFFEKVRHKAQIIWPVETMGYDQVELGIRDGDGYVLAFAEALDEK
jgi:hypothetical protein